jgi:hypothetical protein
MKMMLQHTIMHNSRSPHYEVMKDPYYCECKPSAAKKHMK